MIDDFPTDAQQQLMHEEQEQMALEALARCQQAGAPDEDLQLLAAMLGVGQEYRRSTHPIGT